MSDSFRAGDPAPLAFADTHPAWCAGFGTAGEWEALGASVIGPSHVRRYRARDDAFALQAAGGVIVAVVADGVGGELYSRIGAAHCANAVCQEVLRQMCVPHLRRYGIDDWDQTEVPEMLARKRVVRELPVLDPPADVSQTPDLWGESGTFRWNWTPYRRQFPSDLYEDDDPPPEAPALLTAVEAAYAAARNSLAGLCAELRVKMMACTCTLLTLALDTRTGEAVVAQLGDGAILDWQTLTPAIAPSPRTPEDNPFTIALPNWKDGLVTAASHGGSGWLLLTDGAEDFFPAAGSACRDLLSEGGGAVGKSLRLLVWLNGLSKSGCEDDRTIVAVTDSGRLHL